MPEFDLAAVRARQEQARADLAASTSSEALWHLEWSAIADCPLCNQDGYRGSVVCDHVDRTETASRGIAKVRAAMANRGDAK